MNTKHSLTALFVGLALSTSVMAVTSTPTTTVKGHAPTYTAPTIGHTDTNKNSIIDVGDVLTAIEGTFDDPDGDAKIAPTWRWDGTTNPGNGDSYTIVAGDLGKTIQLFVTPNTDPTITDPAVGTEVGGGTAGAPGTAASVKIAAGDDLLSVEITGIDTSGFPMVGAVLTAEPHCVTTCGTLNYQWQIEDAVGSGTFTDITGATSDTYTPAKGDQKRQIQVVATKP